MMKRLVLAACASLVLAPSATYAAEATMDPQLREKARRAVDAGLHYLRGQQAADGSVAVANRTAGPVPTVILFENRGGHIGFRTAAVTDTVTLDRPTLDAAFPQLRSHLEAALIAEGLFPKEAAAMIETWRDSWFEEGARLIYIVPSRTVDEVLPLEISPAPAQITRVFVGRIELITPATLSAVQQAVADNDHAVAAQYARFVDPILNRLLLTKRVDAQLAQRFVLAARRVER